MPQLNLQADEVVKELAGKNKAAKRIFDLYDKFRKQVTAWQKSDDQALQL